MGATFIHCREKVYFVKCLIINMDLQSILDDKHTKILTKNKQSQPASQVE